MKPKKTLHTKLDKQVRSAIDSVLAFATTKIHTAIQVERQLSHAAVFLGFGDHKALKFTLADGVWCPFKTSGEEGLDVYRSTQSTLKHWLKKLVIWDKLRPRDRASLLEEIRPWTEGRDARIKSKIVRERFVRSTSYEATSVQQVIGEVMYLLFEQSIVQNDGVFACPGCHEYFVKKRTDKKFCSNRCRQRQFRGQKETSI